MLCQVAVLQYDVSDLVQKYQIEFYSLKPMNNAYGAFSPVCFANKHAPPHRIELTWASDAPSARAVHLDEGFKNVVFHRRTIDNQSVGGQAARNVRRNQEATVTESLSPQHRAARAWVKSGYHVFPCVPGTKHPATERGFLDATGDLATIDAWWTAQPDANPAVYPGASGHFVLDIDTKGGKGGDEALMALEIEHGPLPATLTISTPSGGRHLWFKGTVPSSVERVGAGLDIRGTGGYVLIPGSVIDGKYYAVESAAPPADGPDWLRARAAPRVRDIRKVEQDVELDLPTNIARAELYLSRESQPVEGRGSDAQCFKIISAFRDYGLSPQKVLDLLVPWTGFDEDWLEWKIVNAWEYSENDAGSKARQDPARIFNLERLRELAGGPGDVRDGLLNDAAGRDARMGRFKIYTESEMDDLQPPEWCVEGWFPKHGTALLYGAWGAYKSFVATELAMSRATGRAFYGQPGGPASSVLYAAGEGFHGLVKYRRAAWRLRHQIEEAVPFYAMAATPYATPEDCAAFAKTIADAGLSPGIIILDTASRMMAPAGLDENKAVDAGRLVEAAEALARAFEPCLVVVIHHAGKDGDRGARGSSSLPAGFDVVAKIEADKSLIMATVTVEKTKDAEEPKPLHLKGAKVANALVFDPMTDEEHIALTSTNESRVTKDEIKHALAVLEARNGVSVTTNVLAIEIIRQRGVSLDERAQDVAQAHVSKELERALQRGYFGGYVHKFKGPGVHWGYPAPEEESF